MDIVEVMARAMCTRPERIDPEAASMGQDGFIRPAVANRMIELRAALRAAEDAGWVLVPKEPTGDMKVDGGREGNWCDHHCSSDQYELMAVTEAEGVYRAMLAAAPKCGV